ncbi:hypothetical protein [Paracoccus luteus]|uniref:hypothetical protein n=1 Tax=Paracoccus luteus TaxID=2508543 RepID=UPI001FE80988|nr:hypothetical protein [Paracoccus luteus]
MRASRGSGSGGRSAASSGAIGWSAPRSSPRSTRQGRDHRLGCGLDVGPPVGVEPAIAARRHLGAIVPDRNRAQPLAVRGIGQHGIHRVSVGARGPRAQQDCGTGQQGGGHTDEITSMHRTDMVSLCRVATCGAPAGNVADKIGRILTQRCRRVTNRR